MEFVESEDFTLQSIATSLRQDAKAALRRAGDELRQVEDPRRLIQNLVVPENQDQN